MRRRSGYTLMEVLVVMFIIVILGVAIVPTLDGMSRDSRTNATKDLLFSRLHEAKAYAIEEVRPYRVWVSTDGKKIRYSPEEMESETVAVIDPDVLPHVREDQIPDSVTLKPNIAEGQSDQPDQTGWIPIVTFMPDGSCREPGAEFVIQEPNVRPLYMFVRGLTGGVDFGATK